MRFYQTLLTGAALIAAALSLEINTYPSTGVEAGKTYTIEYSPKDNTATTFILRRGASGNLDTVETLTTSATGGSFSWTVSSKYADDSSYALEIKQGDVVNYSGQFGLTGGSGSLSSAVSSASASRASASSASSVSASLSSASSARSASATPSPSAGTNSTVTSLTLSRTATGTTRPTGSSTGGVPESTGAASSLVTSPFAAIVGAFAAFAYLA